MLDLSSMVRSGMLGFVVVEINCTESIEMGQGFRIVDPIACHDADVSRFEVDVANINI